MSWSDAQPEDDLPEALSNRLAALEQTINTQLSEMRTEVGLAAAAIRSADGSPVAPLGDLEGQLARAVTVSLSAALEAIRESLTETIATSVADLASRLERTIAAQPHSVVQTSSGELDTSALVNDVVAQLGSRIESAIATQPPPVVQTQTNELDADALVNDVVALLGTWIENSNRNTTASRRAHAHE